MNTITYSLKVNQSDSENYYSGVAVFTDSVLAQAKKLLQSTVDVYQTNYGKNFYDEECFLELLILGVYWNTYGLRAVGLGKIPCRLLGYFVALRDKQGVYRTGADICKGILSTLFLIKSPNREKDLKYDANHLGMLLSWLEASGEFKQEVKRLKRWRAFLEQQTYDKAVDVITASVRFAAWFEEQSLRALGTYTQSVDRYLEKSWKKHLGHEDVVFCGRHRVEYHLNMVGAEIMNRLYHNKFLEAEHKVLLLPTCMSKPARGECRAVLEGRGFKCGGCSWKCSVKRLSEFGKFWGLKVRMVPHESSIAATKTDTSLFNRNEGVIGVSCVLNLISGGWMLVEKGVYPQCVLLDYCGCKNHWHKEGITTEINERELQRVLENQLIPID